MNSFLFCFFPFYFLLFVLLRCAQSKQQSWRWVWQRFMQIIKWVFKCIIKFRADAPRPSQRPLLLFRPMHALSLWLLAIIKVCPWAQHSPVYSMIAQVFKKLNTPLIKNMSRTTAYSENSHKCSEVLTQLAIAFIQLEDWFWVIVKVSTA